MSRKKNNKSAQPTVAVVLAEMVKAIDDYMLVAPLKIIDWDYANVGKHVFHTQVPYRFSHFESWQERWMGALFPRSLENQQKIADAEPQKQYPKSDTDTANAELQIDTEDFKFLFGYLMGCRAMGATPEQMLTKAKGFPLTLRQSEGV